MVKLEGDRVNALGRFLRACSERESRSIRRALRYGCSWHGLLLSSGCCECGMIKLYQDMEVQ